MNIIAEQLNSKPNTQAMLTSFLQDLKQYFKKAPLLSEDKTYARILRVAETTQRYLPDFHCLSNVSLKLVGVLKVRVDDKFEDMRELQALKSQKNKQQPPKQDNLNDDIEALGKLQIRLSKDKNASVTAMAPLNRQVNQQFMKKQVIQVIQQIIQDFQLSDKIILKQMGFIIQNNWNLLFFDSHLNNKSVVDKLAAQRKANVKYIKVNNADDKNGEINLVDVAAKIRKFQAVIISAQSILKNGCAICQSGSLMVAVAAKKYGIPVILLTRGFCLTEKVMIDQHFLLAQNPMKYFNKVEQNALKVHIGKRFDLIQAKLISKIVSQLGTITPANIELHFSSYYGYV